MTSALSIVIPAYNEEPRIGPSLESILEFASTSPMTVEVVVVNDGSRDRTVEVVKERADKYRIAGVDLRILTNSPNRGKGFSVRRGVFESKGDIVLFTDADLSSPITEAPKLIDPIVAGKADFVFGSRAINRELVGIRQPLLRDLGGRVFNLLVRLVAGLQFKDTQCGFKAFRRNLALPVFALQRIEGFGFDPEILYIAKKRGLRLLETPVIWNNSEGSRVSVISDSLKMFGDLALIRLNDLRGRYRLPEGWSLPAAGAEESILAGGRKA